MPSNHSETTPEPTVADKFDPASFIKTVASKPGVYRMLNGKGHVIYVGKAKNLKKRVSSYFSKKEADAKTRSMVSQIESIETTITNSEKEALLLENNLIKSIRPRYNIVLRDDKSYPYIYLNTSHKYPRLSFHRGSRSSHGQYFGPYPSASSVRQTLNMLQKLFMIRQCEDSFFTNRSRPCLQYQIKRCTAPCMGLINPEQYAEDIQLATLFLEGKSSLIIDKLANKMELASETQAYEKAASYRDQVLTLRKIQEKQYVSKEGGDMDIIACVAQASSSCVQVFFVRGGRNLGNKVFYPKQTNQETVTSVLTAFLTQYYITEKSSRILPDEIIINSEIDDVELIQNVLTTQRGKKIEIRNKVRGDRAQWVKLAESNAKDSLAIHLSAQTNLLARFEALQDALRFDNTPQRIECFDISHTMGESTVASCVVMETEGFVKSDFRRFNIKGITPGDDYAAMRQALTRRYLKIKKGEGVLPDILLIDGGKGQLSEALQVMEELQIEGVTLIGVAKGPERKAGMETLFINRSLKPVTMPAESPALHLIQQVRDEAHRFAITAHRNRRGKTRRTSHLEGIAGLGPKRRKSLLTRFGGLQGVTQASAAELEKVPGINQQLASKIHAYFHEEDE